MFALTRLTNFCLLFFGFCSSDRRSVEMECLLGGLFTIDGRLLRIYRVYSLYYSLYYCLCLLSRFPSSKLAPFLSYVYIRIFIGRRGESRPRGYYTISVFNRGSAQLLVSLALTVPGPESHIPPGP
jgi:hypothetical protein